MPACTRWARGGSGPRRVVFFELDRPTMAATPTRLALATRWRRAQQRDLLYPLLYIKLAAPRVPQPLSSTKFARQARNASAVPRLVPLADEWMTCSLAAPFLRLPVCSSPRVSCGTRLGAPRDLNCLAVRRKFSYQLLSYKKSAFAVHSAVVSAPRPYLDNEEERKQMCERYGFTQIGETLPENITMRDIMATLPKKLFEIDDMKAWMSVLISVTSYALGILMIAKAPWYLLPLAWAWTGTAVTGFFVIGHDCAHKSFSRNKLVEDIVGTLAFLPLIYPYEPWRFQHDRHHAKTNMLIEDTAWQPLWREEMESSPLMRKAIIFGYGPFRPWMSIAHWLIMHFDLKKFRPAEVGRVKISLACVFAFMAIGWPLIIYKAGIIGWIKFWLMPWLGYHFWMSTFTMVHHTAPHIPFKASEDWNAAQAQLNGTVHCNYPRWIEILCHDINVHIPHHISSRIPSYNLRAAHKSLQENWGKYLNQANWSWRLMKTIMTICHVYDEERFYVPFEEVAPEDEVYPIKFLQKAMPNHA